MRNRVTYTSGHSFLHTLARYTPSLIIMIIMSYSPPGIDLKILFLFSRSVHHRYCGPEKHPVANLVTRQGTNLKHLA